MDSISKLFFLFILMLVSFFLSISEISISSSRRIKLQILSEEGVGSAEEILKIQANPGNFFAAILIGINSIAILGGIVGNQIANPFVTKFITTYIPALESKANNIGSVISFFLITLYFIEFADLIPKRLAMVYPEKIAVKVVKPMLFVISLFKPVICFLNGIADLVFKIFNIKKVREEILTYDDIFAIVDAGAEAGVVQKKEHSLIENVFELDNRWVSSVMTPRDEIIYLTISDTQDDIKNKIIESPHTKFLVCKDEIDELLGYINSKDILPKILDGNLNYLVDIRNNFNSDLLIIPNTLTLSETLDRFNEAKTDFAIILNEYSHVVGLVTMKDVVNTLMGDVGFNDSDDQQIIVKDETSWLIDGITAMEEIKKVLVHIDEFPEEEAYETLSGFIMYMLKTIPKKGAKFEYENYTFEVILLDNFKIEQVLVMLIQEEQNILN